MQKFYPLVAIYDAHSDLAKETDLSLPMRAHKVGDALEQYKLGVIGTAGSPVVNTILSKLAQSSQKVIGLSPGSDEYEHVRAYRLSKSDFPMIYTGRGTFGADLMALSSAHAVFIVGDEEKSLTNLLASIGTTNLPVVILSDRNHEELRNVLAMKYPDIMKSVFISNDAVNLAHILISEIRKRNFEI